MKPNPYSRQTFNRNAIMGQSFQPFIYLNTIYVYMWTTLNIVHTYNIFIKYGKDVQLSFTNWIQDRISGPQTNCQSKLYSAKPILQFNKQSWVNWNETLQKYNLHLKKNLSYTDFFLDIVCLFCFISDELEPKLSGSLKKNNKRLNVWKGYEFTHEQR